MNTLKHLALGTLLTVPTLLMAQTYGPGIIIDGNVDEWDGQVPAGITDISGDGGTGRDIQAIYLANDDTNLYVRVQSYNSDAFDGNELGGIDGDNSNATGFDLFGSTRGSDTLIAGASLYGQTTAFFNNGAATPSSISFGPFVASTDIEFSVPLGTTIPGDISNSFPALGNTIGFIYGDGNGGAGDAESFDYTLATVPVTTPSTVIDSMDIYDSTANAAARTTDASTNGALTLAVDNFAAGGPGGVSDIALQGTHTLDSSLPFDVSMIRHRFVTPVDITGNTDITLDFFGDAGSTGANVWVGLIDIDGDYIAVSPPAPSAASWGVVNLGPTSGWFPQAAVAPGGAGGFDADKVIEWRLGLQPGTAANGTYTVGYGSLNAVYGSSVSEWQQLD